LQAADVIANSALRAGATEFAGAYQEPDFITGIRSACSIAFTMYASTEILDIEVKVRNRPQDELSL
jgi:hypothetical protein